VNAFRSWTDAGRLLRRHSVTHGELHRHHVQLSGAPRPRSSRSRPRAEATHPAQIRLPHHLGPWDRRIDRAGPPDTRAADVQGWSVGTITFPGSFLKEGRSPNASSWPPRTSRVATTATRTWNLPMLLLTPNPPNALRGPDACPYSTQLMWFLSPIGILTSSGGWTGVSRSRESSVRIRPPARGLEADRPR
jgi:hypothetical protein